MVTMTLPWTRVVGSVQLHSKAKENHSHALNKETQRVAIPIKSNSL